MKIEAYRQLKPQAHGHCGAISIPELIDETFDVEHANDEEALAYALRVARDLSEGNVHFRGAELIVQQGARLVLKFVIGRLN